MAQYPVTAQFVRPWYATATKSRLHGDPLAARRERIALAYEADKTIAEIAAAEDITDRKVFRHLQSLRRVGRIQGHRPMYANQAHVRMAAE